MELSVPKDHKVKMKQTKKINKYLDLAKELKKAVDLECNSNTNCSCCTQNDPQRLGKKTGGIGYQRENQDFLDHNIGMIGWNQKRPGDLRKLAVTEIPGKNHKLILVGKTHKV